MKTKIAIVCLFAFSPLFIYSQVKGKLLDASTHKAVENAIVQFGDLPEENVVTKADGGFEIPQKHGLVVSIICLGYKSLSVLVDDIGKNPLILLESSPIELKEVEVNYVDAEKLLERAFENTKQKLLVNEYVSYDMHFVQAMNGIDSDELQMSYVSFLKKNSLKNGKIPYELGLISLQILKEDQKESKDYIANCDYQGASIFNMKNLEKYKITLSDSQNDEFLVLKAQQKSRASNSKSYLCYINRNDTTINRFDVEVTSLDKLEYKKDSHFQWATKGMKGRLEFSRRGEAMYMTAVQYTLKLQYLMEDGTVSSVECFMDNKYRNRGSEGPKTKKLNGYSRELFSIKN
ncbi:MAG: CarboxypepD reg-like domain [Bacteroidetes bacterium]|nr:CarboxypepD reg-like domain [Bacteroidota bacterium]